VSDYLSHAAHWGTFSARWDGEHLDIRPHPADPESSPILGNFTNVLRHRARILKPAVRKSWLEHGPKPGRRRLDDTFVEMEWKDVLPLVANTIGDVRDRCGPPRVPRSSVSSMATMSVAITASSWTGGGHGCYGPRSIRWRYAGPCDQGIFYGKGYSMADQSHPQGQRLIIDDKTAGWVDRKPSAILEKLPSKWVLLSRPAPADAFVR